MEVNTDDAGVTKIVTEEEFLLHWRGGDSPESKAAAKDNRNVLASVVNKFRQLSRDERKSCAMTAMWKCLGKHEWGRQKLTTSLYRFATWECLNELRQRKQQSESRMSLAYLPLISRHVSMETEEGPPEDRCDKPGQLQTIRENMGRLPEKWQKTIVRQYYFEGLTYEEIGFRNGGYSKEKARLRLGEAMLQLSHVCDMDKDEISGLFDQGIVLNQKWRPEHTLV